MEKKKFLPITSKINGIIIITLVIGISAIIIFFAVQLSQTITQKTQDNIKAQTNILRASIENSMLSGLAPQVEQLLLGIRVLVSDYKIDLYKSNGTLAFSDNTTINDVNSRLNFKKFIERENIINAPVPVIQDAQFKKAAAIPPENNLFVVKENNKISFKSYRTLINLPNCVGCHNALPTIRGVIDIETDITKSITDQNLTIIISILISLLIVSGLAVVLTQFMRATIIAPVKTIGELCLEVNKGNFTKRLNLTHKDEIGVLANTVNNMVEGLYERFELSKYVSTSTIQALKEKEGKKIPVTVLFTDIRGFTSYSEKNPPETVVEFLNKIISMQTDIIHKNKGDIDKYVGDEIVAIFKEGDDPRLAACRSALQIQQELQEKSDSLYSGLKVGIGITYGEVIMGMIGSDKRADYTVIGDTVNTASRLCGTAKAGEIIISNEIYEHVKRDIEIEGPYKLKVKGKDTYIKVFFLKGMKAAKL